jgi:hypothetical protein
LLRDPNDINAYQAAVNPATGSFEIPDVVPGTYLLRTMQTIENQQFHGQRQVRVGNSDLSGVVVELVPGVTVSGVVHLPAATANQRSGEYVENGGRWAGTSKASVSLTSVVGPAQFYQAAADEQGQFSIEGVAEGRYHVAITASNGYVASAFSGRQDLLRGELVVQTGVAPERIEIDVRDDGGSIAVKTESPEGTVLIEPSDGGEVRFCPASHGSPEIENLPPGSYRLLWVKNYQSIEFRNPEVLRGLRGGVTLEVTAKAKTQVALTEMSE